MRLLELVSCLVVSTCAFSLSTIGQKTSIGIRENDRVATVAQMGSTTDEVKFTVVGDPSTLQRHRIANGRMYNPSQKEQKDFLANCLAELPAQPFEGPLQMELYFFFGRPKSHYRTGKFSHILKPDAPLWFTQKKGRKCIL